MRALQGFGAVLALVLLFPLRMSATSEVKITVSIAAAKQADSPAHVLGFKLPNKPGELPLIVVRNTSSKEIRHIAFWNFLGDPRGKGGADPTWEGNFGMIKSRDDLRKPLAPNETAELPEVALRSSDIGLWAHRIKSNCLHAAFFVTQVEFADGTAWHWDGSTDSRNLGVGPTGDWKNSIRPESMKGCDDAPVTQEALSRMDGTGWNTEVISSPPQPDAVTFFMFSCQIRDDVAWCQF